MNYAELIKLFPDVKIPTIKEARYYLQLLESGGIISPALLEEFEEYETFIVDKPHYKHKKLDEIVAFLKEGWDVSEKYPASEYSLLEFGDFKAKKIYVSFDLRSANWSAWKEIMGKNDLGAWVDFIKTFDVHPLLAKSKSFRQYIFGNTHPKRLQVKQKEIMGRFLKTIPENLHQYLVSRRPDELLFELTQENFAEIYPQLNPVLSIPENINRFRKDIFQITRHQSAGEDVAIKEMLYVLDDGTNVGVVDRGLFQIDGNRFFIHYKNLILKQPIEERDLLFSTGKHMAKWVL